MPLMGMSFIINIYNSSNRHQKNKIFQDRAFLIKNKKNQPKTFLNEKQKIIIMAGFDKSLDKEIFGEEAKFETTKIKISVMSYNEGTPKLQIARENLNPEDGEWRWSKLGRMTKEESEAVLPLIEKAIQNM